MTEWTEYVSSEEEHAAKITAEKGFQPGSPEHAAEMETFHKHMAKYRQDRLHPNMPDWQIFCFYPMSKRRNDGNNWYAQPFAERRKLMAGHATTGRKYSGRVRQLITGSTGLDEHEWGVTLFSHTTSDIKRSSMKCALTMLVRALPNSATSISASSCRWMNFPPRPALITEYRSGRTSQNR